MSKISEELLVGFDEEMAATKKTLERVPFDKPDWKPHEKSMAITRLATHVATLPRMGVVAITDDSIDVATDFKMPEVKDVAELVTMFEELSRKARAAIEHATDEHLETLWKLTANGKTIFEVPRTKAIRVFFLNHMIHHRAQLGVYLRLNDLPVPGIYGPSADEKIM